MNGGLMVRLWFFPILSLVFYSAFGPEPASAMAMDRGFPAANLQTVAPPVPPVFHGVIIVTNGEGVAGKVAVREPNGTITQFSSDDLGRFSLPATPAEGEGPSDFIIGVYTNSTEWTGQSIEVVANTEPQVIPAVQEASSLTGRVVFAGPKYAITNISLRNVITHAEYTSRLSRNGAFAMTIPVGQYQVLSLGTPQGPIYVLSPLMASAVGESISVEAPILPKELYMSSHFLITGNGSGVTSQELLTIDRCLESAYPQIAADLPSADSDVITVKVFDSVSAYQSFFSTLGNNSLVSSAYAERSVAVAVGADTIAICLPHLAGVDVLNLCAHELTHVMVARIDPAIPSWLNEGLAWYEGIRAELSGSPSGLLSNGIKWTYWTNIVSMQKQGRLDLLSLSGGLFAKYNVEAQDYFAFETLVHRYSLKSVLDYIREQDGQPNAFDNRFHETFGKFSAEVTSDLIDRSRLKDRGFRVVLHVTDTGPGAVVVSAPSGRQTRFEGLLPGATYTFTCSKTGHVRVDSQDVERTVLKTPADKTTMWHVTAAPVYLKQSQAFLLKDVFGNPYLVGTAIYNSKGQVLRSHPATELPMGLQLVSLSPIQRIRAGSIK